MSIKVGSVYNVTVKSGNTQSAFSWPGKVPDSGNKYMKNKVIKITKKLNPEDSLDYDYIADIYDRNDGAIELRDIEIVSKQLLLKSSTFKVAGKRKKSKKRTKKKKSKKRTKRKSKRSSRKTRRSYIKKTRKRMKGGAAVMGDREKLMEIKIPSDVFKLSKILQKLHVKKIPDYYDEDNKKVWLNLQAQAIYNIDLQPYISNLPPFDDAFSEAMKLADGTLFQSYSLLPETDIKDYLLRATSGEAMGSYD
jgi:hypothetical protein